LHALAPGSVAQIFCWQVWPLLQSALVSQVCGRAAKGVELGLEPQAIAINAKPVPANFLPTPNTLCGF
jgi:hypothetical protein